jgi:hypothetical protein
VSLNKIRSLLFQCVKHVFLQDLSGSSCLPFQPFSNPCRCPNHPLYGIFIASLSGLTSKICFTAGFQVLPLLLFPIFHINVISIVCQWFRFSFVNFCYSQLHSLSYNYRTERNRFRKAMDSCTPMAYMYFPNASFANLLTSFVLMFIYCRQRTYYIYVCVYIYIPLASRSKAHIVSMLEHWDHGFESHSTHGCISAFLCVVLPWVGRRLAMNWSPIQGVLPKWLKRFIVPEVNSESEKSRRSKSWT